MEYAAGPVVRWAARVPVLPRSRSVPGSPAARGRRARVRSSLFTHVGHLGCTASDLPISLLRTSRYRTEAQ